MIGLLDNLSVILLGVAVILGTLSESKLRRRVDLLEQQMRATQGDGR